MATNKNGGKASETATEKKARLKEEKLAAAGKTPLKKESGSSPDTGSSPIETGSSPAESGSSPEQTGSSPEQTGSSPDLSKIKHAGIGMAFHMAEMKSMGRAFSDDQPVVIIPYKQDVAAGDELLFAVRAWAKNYPDCRIVIIGDAEDWFSDEIAYIKTTPNVLGKNPQIDVAMKLLVAIADPDIPENFIWSNDDIYPVTHIMNTDISFLKCNGPLPASKPGVNGIYAQNKQRTLDALRARKLSAWDYSTHTPFLFNKEKLAAVIEEYRADEEGHLVSSLYFNTHYPKVVPVRIDPGAAGSFMAQIHRADPPPAAVAAAMTSRKFINVNDKGYGVVLPYLKKMFPDKSRFEK